MLKLEHIGIAVEEGSVGALTFERLFGAAPYKHEPVAQEGVETIFIDAGGPKFELLESTDSDSTIARFLKKRGEGLHHIAVEVEDIGAQFDRLRREGFTVLSEAPVEGADGKQIFFVHPRDCHGVLVEFCQQTRPTWMRAEIEMTHGVVTTYSAGSTHAAPVLLLHDQNSSATKDFDELLPTLERSMYVVAFDAPGHGGARGWDAGTGILSGAAKHARAVLTWYHVDGPAVIVGRGLAAEAAVQVARSYPDLVHALVFIDPGKSLVAVLDQSLPDIPMLVCSFSGDSLGATDRIARRFPQIQLSVIPRIGRSHSQLAELIAAI